MSKEKKTVFIIGGSGGIGKEVSLKYGQEGYNLVVQGSSLEKLEELKNQFEKTKKPQQTIELLPISFGKEKISKKDMDQLKKYLEQSEILVICFGPFLQKEIHNTTDEEWESLVYWNYTFPGELISFALNFMMKNQYGRIVVFGGTRTHSVNGFRTNAVYAGAKTALCSLVKSVASEYGKYNITCNGILPGFVETEYLTQETKEMLKAKMPKNELISPKSIAETIFFVTNCRDINGALINIDEGWMP